MSLTAVTTLQVLDLSNNRLTGDIPVTGSFSQFTSISFSNNLLNNPPPSPPPPVTQLPPDSASDLRHIFPKLKSPRIEANRGFAALKMFLASILKIPGFTDNVVTHLLSGLGAGFFAVCIGSPVDVPAGGGFGAFGSKQVARSRSSRRECRYQVQACMYFLRREQVQAFSDQGQGSIKGMQLEKCCKCKPYLAA